MVIDSVICTEICSFICPLMQELNIRIAAYLEIRTKSVSEKKLCDLTFSPSVYNIAFVYQEPLPE